MARQHTDLPSLQREIAALDDRYELRKVIGAGSYGVVLKAYDRKDVQDGKPVECAVKKVSKEIFTDMTLAKRILREIKLLAHFDNENIVSVRNLVTPPSAEFKEFFIVMDLMETDLKSVFKSGQKMTNAHIQYFLYQILRAMKFIHTAQVIHRDITPANILVNINCDLKICDFGLARDTPGDDEQYMTDYVTMRWYRAPELVMESKVYTAAVDVWGIGAIMSEMFGSKPLFPGKDRVNQLDKIIDVIGTPPDDELKTVGSEAAQRYIKKKSQRQRTDFKKLFPQADPQGIDIMDRMLVFHPSKRLTVEAGLEHPYLSELHDPEDEDVSEVKAFDCDYERGLKSLAEVKKAIFDETMKFHERFPKTRPHRGGVQIQATGEPGRAQAGTLDRQDVVGDTGFS
eukprot:TRINITY_DN1011_c0_g1_i1.p1 TRINITY_DN1011_c0_g1~~TRINITY_DN1011_c0_g1_i1.p1  ORF type:complete len:429 (+),score=146.86 TRINITY_DN1011_c0_g1_i1:88-1287(+)